MSRCFFLQFTSETSLTVLIAIHSQERLSMVSGGGKWLPRCLMLVFLSLYLLPGCDDRGPNTKASKAVDSVEVNHVTAAQQQMAIENWDAATELAYRALVESPDNLSATIIAAEAEGARGNYQVAIDLLSPIDLRSQQGPQVSELLVQQCLALNAQWEAADALLNGLSVYPQQSPWRVQAWTLLNRCGRRQEASDQAAWLCRAGKANRQQLESLVARTFAYPLPGIASVSEKDFSSGLGKARWYFSLQEYRKALHELRRVEFVEHSSHPASLALEGRLLTELQQFEQIPEWFSRCDANIQRFNDYWAAVGTYLFDHSQYSESVIALLRAIALDPTDRMSVQRMSRGLAALERSEDSEQFRYRGTQLANCEQNLEKLREPSEVATRIRKLQALFLELGRPFEAIGWTLLTTISPEQKLLVDQQRQTLLLRPDTANMASVSGMLGLKHEEFGELVDLETLMGRNQKPLKLDDDLIKVEVLPRLSDVAKKVGVGFQWYQDFDVNPDSIPIHESIGGGIGVLDYNLDGWPDLYLAQGSGEPPSGQCTRSNKLFVNKDGAFSDCTPLAGASDHNYSAGIAVGDVNQDGFQDLLLGALGRNRLLINNGDGTFADATSQLGLREDRFTSSLAIGDLNGDALPDIYEVNYIEMKGGFDLPEKGPGGRELLPSPLLHYPDADRWLESSGEGKFTPHSIAREVAEPGTGLGVVITDFDGDGLNEIFVGNDVRPNHFLSHAGGEKFENSADARGLANGFQGTANGCMGIATGDFNRDLKIDLHVTNYIDEAANLYLRSQGEAFSDQAVRYGLAELSLRNVGFGTKAVDFDRNGWLDLAVVNGHIFDLTIAGHPFRMLPQIMMNVGRKFEACEVKSDGDYWDTPALGRTMAKLDFNRDGAIDLAIGHLDRPFALLENQTQAKHPWIQFRLVATKSERNAIGARIELTTNQGSFAQWVTSGDGYLCSDEQAIDFGLGTGAEIQRIVVDWPSGERQIFPSSAVNRRYLLIENQDHVYRYW